MLHLKNASALNDNGNLKPAVRKSLVNHVANHPELFAKAKRVGDKAVFSLAVEDMNGVKFFVNFDVTVSTKHPSERAEKKAGSKAKAEPTSVEVE